MSLTLAQWFFVFPFGMFLSTVGTLAGLGGGVFMVPVLVLVYAVPLKMAIAAVTFSLVPASLLSTMFNVRGKNIDYFAAITLEIPTIFGTLLGAYLTGILPVKPMEMMFACFVAFMGYRILKGKKRAEGEVSLLDKLNRIPPVIERSNGTTNYHAGVPALGIFGTVSGILAGMFGIGGGIIKTPVMLKIFRMPARRATATALCMMVFTTSTAAVSHWQGGRMDWNLALPLGGAFFCGSFIGNKLAGKAPQALIERILGTVLILAALTLVVHTIFLKETV